MSSKNKNLCWACGKIISNNKTLVKLNIDGCDRILHRDCSSKHFNVDEKDIGRHGTISVLTSTSMFEKHKVQKGKRTVDFIKKKY